MNNIDLNEEEMDFLNEAINVGSGNAAVALEQLLGSGIEVEIPFVSLIHRSSLSSVIDSIAKPLVGVRMNVLGDLHGDLFFVVSNKYVHILTELASKARPGGSRIKIEPDESAIGEIANIMAGVCLTSIHDFCGINAYHTVPEMQKDMLLALVDESIATRTKSDPNFIWIETIFKVNGKENTNIPVYFVIILTVDSLLKFKEAIQKANKKMFEA